MESIVTEFIKYIIAGLAALGAGGRHRHSVHIEMFGDRDASRSRPSSDAHALYGDWEAVGNDLRKAMDDVRRETDYSEALPEPF